LGTPLELADRAIGLRCLRRTPNEPRELDRVYLAVEPAQSAAQPADDEFEEAGRAVGRRWLERSRAVLSGGTAPLGPTSAPQVAAVLPDLATRPIFG
jgi:hypothetical protein